VKRRVLIGIGALGVSVACALLFFAPRLLSTSIATAEVTPGKTLAKNPDLVRVNVEQLHQLNTVPVTSDRFSIQKPAVGQIAFNEDMSTVVLTPFSGRVTRLIAKIGDEVKRGDPLFEIDSPEVVQAQTDLIAALHGVDKAKSQLALAKRVMDRQSGLMNDKVTSQRELDSARNDFAAAESDLATAQSDAILEAQIFLDPYLASRFPLPIIHIRSREHPFYRFSLLSTGSS
jgi:cobalt-zinc-cadmium efflux system membrane fusion protein